MWAASFVFVEHSIHVCESFEVFDLSLVCQAEAQQLTLEDYVGIIQDAVVMEKNVCIMRQ